MTLHPEPLAPDIGRVLEGGIGIAAQRGQRRGTVGRGAVDQQYMIRARTGRGRQGVDVELDRLKRILGRRRAIGDHDGDRLADIADLAMRDHRLLVGLERRHLLLPERNLRDGAERRAHVRRRDDGVHPGARERRRRVDGDDAAMRHGAAQDRRMQQAVAHDVVDILAAAAQETQVLDALDRAADQRIRLAESSAHKVPAGDDGVSSCVRASNAGRL